MPVQELPIGGNIQPALGARQDVVEFDDITVHEEQVASTATALLALEQASRSRPDEGRLAVSSSPVEPVAIIRTAVSLHLGKAADGRIRMIRQFHPGIVFQASRKDPVSVADSVPVLQVHPSPVFLWVPPSSPTL